MTGVTSFSNSDMGVSVYSSRINTFVLHVFEKSIDSVPHRPLPIILPLHRDCRFSLSFAGVLYAFTSLLNQSIVKSLSDCFFLPSFSCSVHVHYPKENKSAQ